MTKGPEGLLHQRLKDNLPKALIVRLENQVNLGLPDCLIALPPKGYLLMELKVVKAGKKIRLSPHQVAFAMKHSLLKMPTFILVEWHPKGTQKKSERQLLLYDGKQAQELYMKGVLVEPLGCWALDNVDWNEVRGLLENPERIRNLGPVDC